MANPPTRRKVAAPMIVPTSACIGVALTFDMRGGRQPAKPDVGRPLDGRVRAHSRAHLFASAFDAYELRATGRTALDGHRGLAAAELLGYQRNEFFICLSFHWRRLELSRPQPRA